jgi:broad-specificity NMP kinase
LDEAMIIWLDGPFGVGKTTTARLVRDLLSGSVIFDPEEIGYVVRHLFPNPTGDFQDIAPWRRLVGSAINGLTAALSPPDVIVPMTVRCEVYAGEIRQTIAAAGHSQEIVWILLTAAPDVLRSRIQKDVLFPDDPAKDAAARAWRLAALDQALPVGAPRDGEHIVIDTSTSSPSAVAQEIVRCVEARRTLTVAKQPHDPLV